MVASFFNYHAMLNKAMQQVVRSVLLYVAERGLPGQHHFYVVFSTKAPGVVLPTRVLDRYPEQITIVLQHEFYDLKIESESISVSLVFDGVKEHIVVPFDSLIEFSDPFANFSMQLDTSEWSSSNTDEDEDDDDDYEEGSNNPVIIGLSTECDLTESMTKMINREENNQAKGKGDLIFIEDYFNR